MSARKMVFSPIESEDVRVSDEKNEKPKRIERDLDKIHKLLKIVLKIAVKNGYNEDLSINDENGKPISDSDITNLLNHALSYEKPLIGENEFIRLLYESNVNPNWIVNENVRSKLLSYIPKTKPKEPPKELPNEPIPPPEELPNKVIEKVIKKPSKRYADKSNEEPVKKKKHWAWPSDDESDIKKSSTPWDYPLPESDDE